MSKPKNDDSNEEGTQKKKMILGVSVPIFIILFHFLLMFLQR